VEVDKEILVVMAAAKEWTMEERSFGHSGHIA
jgi:hypothetical protein